MKGLVVLSVLCVVCLLSVGGDVAEGQRDGYAESKGAAPVIVLTGFDVNDQSMEVRYKIVNRRTHDTWVCDAVYLKDSKGKGVPPYHDVYMAEDGLTLVVRKQLEVLYERSPTVPRDYAGRYVRLLAGEERVGSFSLSLPAEQRVVLALGWPPAGEHATRMALRVGFHDEDLWEKMRRIVTVAERIGGAQLESCLETVIDGVLIPLAPDSFPIPYID